MKICVVGASGRMGRRVAGAVQDAEDLELCGSVDVGDDVSQVLRDSSPDVVVDFTNPGAINEHLPLYLDREIRPVVGTTGIRPEVLRQARCRSAAAGVGGVVAPNFSVGAVLLMELGARAARFLPRVEISEYHHPDKHDAPSGTALLSRQKLQDALGSTTEIPIHSVRLPGFLASQEIYFGGSGERLTLRHDAIDRGCFIPGVLLAIRRCPELREIVVGLESLLDLP